MHNLHYKFLFSSNTQNIIPATHFSLSSHQFCLLLGHFDQHINIYMLITPSTPTIKMKKKLILTLMSSSNNCLIFLLPFTVKFLQLSIFISNSTFFWNHTVHVFNSHHPTRWLAMVISNGIDFSKSIGQASGLIWFDPVLNTVDHSPVWTVFQIKILSYFFLILHWPLLNPILDPSHLSVLTLQWSHSISWF